MADHNVNPIPMNASCLPRLGGGGGAQWLPADGKGSGMASANAGRVGTTRRWLQQCFAVTGGGGKWLSEVSN